MSIAKLRFNLNLGEIEIEGSEEFVERQTLNLENILKVLKESQVKLERAIPVYEELIPTAVVESTSSSKHLPETFGEWIHKLPRDANDVTKVLLAGYYLQKQSEDNMFRTRDVNKLLKDHGVSVGNASQTVKNNVEAKRIFQVSKTGQEANYRVSRDQELELIGLLQK